MDPLYVLAFGLLAKLLFDSPTIPYKEPPPPRPVQALRVEAPQSINIPEWVTHTPENCFVGISKPCRSLQEAREQAIHSAVSQILQAMGAEYRLQHQSTISGNIHHSRHELREQLSYTARWFVRSVQQSIEKSDIQRPNGKYMYFVLVNFPPPKIERLRKLSIGPRISATIVRRQPDRLLIEIAETNGVPVKIHKARATTTLKLKHAGFINYYICRARKTRTESQIIHILPLTVCNSTKKVVIELSPKRAGLFYSRHTIIELKGTDEIGRLATAQIRF